MDIHGSLVVDITALLENCDPDKPVLLSLTRCDAEGGLAQALGGAIEGGQQYPFLPGTSVFSPLGEQPMEAKGQTIAGARPAKGSQVQRKQGKQDDPHRMVKVYRGRCDRCGNKTAELIPGMNPPICFDCAKIDLYQARKEKPNSPDSDDKLPEEFR